MISFLEGDVIEQLKLLPDCSIQCVVTSPPYFGLRDYNVAGQIGMEETPEIFTAKMVEVFREVKRVLRDDGTLWLNFGDSYCGCGTGHKETGKAVYEGADYDSAAKNRTKIPGIKSKDLIGIPWMVAFALRADGWYLRSDIIWSKPNPMPESVTDRPTKAHEYVFLMTKSARYFYDADAVREKYLDSSIERLKQGFNMNGLNPAALATKNPAVKAQGIIEPNPAGRNRRTVWEIATQPTPDAHFATFPEALVEPCIKAGTSERGCCAKCGKPWERVVETKFVQEGATRNRGAIKSGDKNAKSMTMGDGGKVGHNETKTLGWQPACTCNADTVPCVVLDPFGGSGTTAKVATRLGRDCILIELNHHYIKIAKKKNGLNPIPISHAHSLGYDVKVMKKEVW